MTSSHYTDQPLGPKGLSADTEYEDNECWASYGRGRVKRFPPAMPLLARMGNRSCHMPWVLERTYRADGSLVIREVRARRHCYFRAKRENGRLELRLVELDQNSPLFRENIADRTAPVGCEQDAAIASRSCMEVSPLHRPMSSMRAVHA